MGATKPIFLLGTCPPLGTCPLLGDMPSVRGHARSLGTCPPFGTCPPLSPQTEKLLGSGSRFPLYYARYFIFLLIKCQSFYLCSLFSFFSGISPFVFDLSEQRLLVHIPSTISVCHVVESDYYLLSTLLCRYQNFLFSYQSCFTDVDEAAHIGYVLFFFFANFLFLFA